MDEAWTIWIFVFLLEINEKNTGEFFAVFLRVVRKFTPVQQ